MYDVEPVIQIFTESSLFYFFFHIAVRRSDDAHVDVDRLFSADTDDFMILQHAQKLYLHARVDFADFVEKNRAFVREFETPLLHFFGSGVRAFFVTEQFAFEQRFAQSRAVHFYHFVSASRREIVDRIGDEFFSHTAFAGYQNGRFRRCDFFDKRKHFLHFAAFADHIVERMGA